jgi:Icc-related predicted phosphoesterase
MKLIFISDTHGKHHDIQLPEGDILIHAGDLSSRGQAAELQDFLDWFSTRPHTHKIFVGGNHDFMLERSPKAFAQLIPPNCTYLRNEAVVCEGIRIWGSPITPWFYDWAFNRRRGQDIRRYWDRIPDDTDLLVTHGPPLGILDQTARGESVGCEDLLHAIQRIRPRIHVFGHIHEAYGQEEREGTLYLNASNLNLAYQAVNPPIAIDWKNYQSA